MAIDVNPTNYSVSDFLNWQKDGTLDLRPPFQRKAIWRAVLKSSLIDSVLRGYPIPALFLQDKSDTTTFKRRIVVIDGQQRLRTLLGFIDKAALPDADDRDDFAISKVHNPARAGRRYVDLSEAEKHQILHARLNVYVVDSTVGDSEILEIFRRMNSYGVMLNPQELRNARFHGYFKEIAYGLSSGALDYWLNWGLFNRQQIAEMRDVEFVSDLLMLFLRGVQGTTQSAIDKLYVDFDEDFPLSDECSDRFATLTAVTDSLFADAGLRRLANRMWTYTIFDVLQRVKYGGPIEPDGRPAVSLKERSVARALKQLVDRIEKRNLPDDVEKAIRGAANDRGSRETRADFLISLAA
jgi:hypothetical protein